MPELINWVTLSVTRILFVQRRFQKGPNLLKQEKHLNSSCAETGLTGWFDTLMLFVRFTLNSVNFWILSKNVMLY